jgi:hypothetical protein
LSTYGEMRETEEKERGKILNEDGRELGWMKEIWKKRERTEKDRGGGKNLEGYFVWDFFFWQIKNFVVCT